MCAMREVWQLRAMRAAGIAAAGSGGTDGIVTGVRLLSLGGGIVVSISAGLAALTPIY